MITTVLVEKRVLPVELEVLTFIFLDVSSCTKGARCSLVT